MISAIVALAVLAIVFGLGLGYAAVRFRVEGDPVAEQILKVLPQTQCGQCGYAGCRPYAEAIAGSEADINRCPPGGEEGIRALADLLDREPVELDPDCGEEQVATVAIIDEQTCIGCTLCIQACPIDAIIGAPKLMHTVIEQECTGCELCLPPCPVECIRLEAVPVTLANWRWSNPASGELSIVA